MKTLNQKIEEIHIRQPAKPDPVIELARQIMADLGVTWTQAYENAKAIGEFRRMDERRRVNHEANRHLWCVPWDCPDEHMPKPSVGRIVHYVSHGTPVRLAPNICCGCRPECLLRLVLGACLLPAGGQTREIQGWTHPQDGVVPLALP